VLLPLLDGLEQVHNAGFLHRDIKPANILLNAAGKPTLIDFGASRMAMAGRTSAMTAVFTPGYAATEQMTSAKQGPWTDVYGISATIYHAITGKAPPSAFDRMLDDAYVSLGKLLPPGFAPGLLAGIDAGLALRASDRPQSIAGWRPIFAYAGGSATDATVVMRPSVEPAAARTALPPASRSRVVLYGAIAAAVLALLAGGYLMLSGKPPSQSAAVQDLKVEQLEQILAERRKADAEAAEKRRLEEEARRKGTEEAAAKVQADSDVERTRIERQKAEQELAQLKAQIEARRKEEADLRRIAADEAAKRKAEAEIATLKAAEEQARQKAADEAESKRLADDALAKAETERKKADEVAAARAQAEAEAKTKADAETRQRAEEAADRKAAEAAEVVLRLEQPDRRRLQVALTSLGFDTRGNDGTFGPRTREMIGAWQKARNIPSTGFLNVAQQQALLKEAAPALARHEEEQKKADEEKKKIDEARKKAEEEAKARATSATPSAAPAPASAPAAPTNVVPDGLYAGGMTSPERSPSGFSPPLRVTAEVINGRGSGRIEISASANPVAPGVFSFVISSDGGVSGSGDFPNSTGRTLRFNISGTASNSIALNFTGLSRPASVT
jgi:peptidoglycan hydrolase-like protein with peptidoglycan-binding domain